MFFSTMQTEGNIVEIALLWYLTSSVIRSGSVFFQFDFTSVIIVLNKSYLSFSFK